MTQQASNTPGIRLGYESLILEAFQAREKKNSHWADPLIHLVPHDHLPSLAYHHQHSQYHLVLFWLENYFSHAARWMGVRELARLALDFLEQSQLSSEDADVSAARFVEFIRQKKQTHRSVAQLECLMRCGLACWKLSSAAWNPELSEWDRSNKDTLVSLIEHQHAAYVESEDEWSLSSLWTAVKGGGALQHSSAPDVLIFYRKNEFEIDCESMPRNEFWLLMSR